MTAVPRLPHPRDLSSSACGSEPAEASEVRRLPASAAVQLSGGAKLARTIVVVSVVHGAECRGMTADSFTVVSDDPPLVLVAVGVGSQTHRLLGFASGFAVSVLAEEHEDLATHFASRRRPLGIRQFDVADWEIAPFSGAPVLTEALLWIDCGHHSTTPAGDHVLIVGEVVGVGGRPHPGRPLVRFDGEYQSLHPTRRSTPRPPPPLRGSPLLARPGRPHHELPFELPAER